MLPIADFLAGALLSLLLPTVLLTALVVWYLIFLRRVPDTTEPEPARAVGNPGPDAPAGAGSASGDG
jgi:hypothetical protein